jgi:hypothetical protein
MPFTIFLAPEFPFDYSGIPENAEAAAQNFSVLPLIFLYFIRKSSSQNRGQKKFSPLSLDDFHSLLWPADLGQP